MVVVLAAEGREVLLVVGEREALDQHLVQFEALHDLECVEVPNDDVGLNVQLVSHSRLNWRPFPVTVLVMWSRVR